MRPRLTYALAALFTFQLLHGFAPPPEGDGAEGGNWTGTIGGLGFLLLTMLAWYWAYRRDDRGRRLGLLLGVAIPVGFVLYHGAWFTSPITNPYWGDGTATTLQWLTLPPVLVAGVVTAVVAARAPAAGEAPAAATA